jgi:hypothetical protein
MDACEFAKDPWPHSQPDEGLKSIPPDWIAMAWDKNSAFREVIVDQFVRSLKKTGSFLLASEEMTVSQRGLDADRVVQLYCELRTMTRRNEIEWRLEFETLFPKAAAALPPVFRQSVDRFDFGNSIAFGIIDKNIPQLKYLLRHLETHGIDLQEIKVIDYGLLGLTNYEIATLPWDELDKLVADKPRSFWPSVVEYARMYAIPEVRNLFDLA